MKLSPALGAPAVALAAFLLTANGAFAAGATTGACPPGQTMVGGNCVATSSVNYNGSKSNSGNFAAPNNAATGQPGMAVKGSGVPKNTTKTIDSTSPGPTDTN